MISFKHSAFAVLFFLSFTLSIIFTSCGGGADGGSNSEMVLVPGGCFQMGDTFGDGYSAELPVHQVCLSTFHIDKYEVTQADYQSIKGSNPSYFTSCGGNCPVERVIWNEADSYCKAVGKRLPTEAEWEYAARSGGQSQKWAGTSTESQLVNYAWYGANADGTTHAVGQKLPNSLGLYDMSGNVSEFVADWYDSAYYSVSPVNNPTGPASGTVRVFRGGSWYPYGIDTRASFRGLDEPDLRFDGLGFRCANHGK